MARISFEEAAKLLRDGNVVGIPTETVYGLAASLYCPDAIAHIFRLKGRPLLNPLIVHVANAEEARALSTSWSPSAEKLAALWPGPLTLLLPANLTLVPEIVRAGLPTVGIRVPSHPLCRELLAITGPLVAPSANLSGRPSSSTASHVEEDFGSNFPVLDGGPCRAGLESTIVMTEGMPRIARLGAWSAEQIEGSLGIKLESHSLIAGPTEQPICPGQLYQHYAPRARLHLCSRKEPGRHSIVLGLRNREYGEANVWPLGDSDTPEEVAASLYAALRKLDQQGISTAWIEDRLPNVGLWATIQERIHRAAGTSQDIAT